MMSGGITIPDMKSDIDVILHILASFYFGVIEVHLGPRLYGYQNWLAFI